MEAGMAPVSLSGVAPRVQSKCFSSHVSNPCRREEVAVQRVSVPVGVELRVLASPAYRLLNSHASPANGWPGA